VHPAVSVYSDELAASRTIGGTVAADERIRELRGDVTGRGGGRCCRVDQDRIGALFRGALGAVSITWSVGPQEGL
jgi:hypothetical protein